uniref:Male-enhanced antigen 1 n=1 Tax=Clastoptera arizonana TaxID=38151 RepID=A0A1B6CS64_9HEMI
MVNEWFPEPPQDTEGRLSAPSQIVFVEDELSDDDLAGFAPTGYELLSLQGFTTDEEEDSNEEEDIPINEPVHSRETSEQPADPETVSEVEVQASFLNAPTSTRSDINVNFDEVRAAMVGFTLPPSSIPPWAANIPESQWTNTLIHHIQRIQSTSTDS